MSQVYEHEMMQGCSDVHGMDPDIAAMQSHIARTVVNEYAKRRRKSTFPKRGATLNLFRGSVEYKCNEQCSQPSC